MAAVVRRVLYIVGSSQSQSFKIHYRSSSSSTSSCSNPLLLKLLQLPNSKIKPTLDSSSYSDLKNSEFSFDSLVTALTSSSPEKARLVLEWRLDWMLNKNVRDCLLYCNLIYLCAKIRNVSLAIRAFTCMEATGIKPNTPVFNSLLHVCLSSTSHVLTALSLFEIMEESSGLYEPNSETYDAFVSGFSCLGDADKMHAWFQAKMTAGFSPNLQNYQCLISTYVKVKDYDKADRFFQEIMSLGTVPSVPILEWVLEGLCRRRNYGGVGEFLNFLLDSRFEITGNMIEKVVELYSQLGKIDEMEKLLETLEFNQVGDALVVLHCGIIRFYAKSDRLDDVEYSVGRMMSRGMLFKSSEDVEKIISSYFRKEAYDRLDLFLEHVKGYQKLTRSTYDLLVAGYRRARLADKLELVMRDMKLAGLL